MRAALERVREALEALAREDDEAVRLAHVESTWPHLMRVVEMGCGGYGGLAAAARSLGIDLALYGQPVRMRERRVRRGKRVGRRTMVPGPMRKMERPDV